MSSTDLSCCALHELLVFPPRGGTDDFAIAAFSVLRARAARIPNSQIGLEEDIRCGGNEGPVRAVSNGGRGSVGRVISAPRQVGSEPRVTDLQ